MPKAPPRTPQEKSLAAQIAVHTSWARTADRSARTKPARQALLDRFEREVDPEGILPADERARRADNAHRAFMLRMSLASAKARRERQAQAAANRAAARAQVADVDLQAG